MKKILLFTSALLFIPLFSCSVDNEQITRHEHIENCCGEDSITRSGKPRCMFCFGLGLGLDFGEKCKYCGEVIDDWNDLSQKYQAYFTHAYGDIIGGGGGSTDPVTRCKKCKLPSPFCMCKYLCDLCGKMHGKIYLEDVKMCIRCHCDKHAYKSCFACNKLSCGYLWKASRCPWCGIASRPASDFP